MDDPVKLIYKYKNLNKRSQYQLFIYVGFLLDESIKKILLKIKNLNFYDTLMELSVKEIEQLNKIYGNNWYTKLFLVDHLDLSINLIQKTPVKRKEIDKKFGKGWLENNITGNNFFNNRMYSYHFLFKRERELRERNKSLREKQQPDSQNYSTKNIQIGGDDEGDENNEDEDDDGVQSSQVIDKNIEFDDVDEFDLEELENMYQEVEVDDNIKTTSKMIDNVMKIGRAHV